MKHSDLHTTLVQASSTKTFDDNLVLLIEAIDQKNGNADSWISILDKEIAVKQFDCERVYNFYRNRSIYYQTIKSNYNKAIQSCNMGLALVNDAYPKCANNRIVYNKFKGINHYLLGQYEKSLDHYFKAIDLINVSNEDNDLEKAAILNNISIVFNKKEDSEVRRYYVNKALEIYERKESDAGRMKGYINLGNIATKDENFKEAVSYNLKAKRINDRVKDKTFAGSIYNNLGCNYLELKEFDKAEEYILKAIELKSKDPDLHSRIISEISLAELYIVQSKGKEAIEILEKWLSKAQEAGILAELVQLYGFLAKAHALENNHEKAYKFLNLQIEIDRQLLGSEKQRNLVEANAKFRAQLTENEARFYKKKEQDLQKYTNELEDKNRELSIFAQLSAHDLKEPIRMIKINLDFLKQSTSGELSEEQNQMLDFAYKNSNRLAETVDDVLKLTKVDNSPPVFEKVNINKIVQDLEEHLQPIIFQNKVEIVYRNLPTIQADYSQFQLLFETMISNSIKNNENAKPKIEISYKEQNDFHQFFIEDNGASFSQEFLEDAFNMASKTTQIKKNNDGNGIAIAVCKRVVERYKGNIVISNKEQNEGSIISFTIGKRN